VGNDPVDGRDPTGLEQQNTGIWIEEASGNEPLGHESVGVGNPAGNNSTYSMGVADAGASLLGGRGEVYLDTTKGGAISAFYPTTPRQAAAINRALAAEVGRTTKYNIISNNCRHWSNEVIHALVKKFDLHQVQSPRNYAEPRTSHTIGGSSGASASRGSVTTGSPGPSTVPSNSSLPPPNAPPQTTPFDPCAAHPGAC
jgi:hypothetical protein